MFFYINQQEIVEQFRIMEKEKSSLLKSAKDQNKKSKPPGNELKKYTIDSIIQQLKNKGNIPKNSFRELIANVIPILKNQPNILTVSSPVHVVGDIHGYSSIIQKRQFYDLLTIFSKHGNPPESKYLFLGDYVDRGMFGIEVITFLLFLKYKYPAQISLLRGNHESQMITSAHNFQLQCKTKYSINIYNEVIELFQSLPVCAVVDDKFFGVHAGISPDTFTLNDIQKINRFQEVPPKGILCDLLWSDPSEESTRKWQFNKMRSCSYYYSPELAQLFLKANKLKLILRGHEVEIEGYKYQENKKRNHKTTLTIFSAPNYCDKYKNYGSIAFIDKGSIALSHFQDVQHPFVFPHFENTFEFTVPLIANCATRMLLHSLSNKLKRKKKVNSNKSSQEIKSEIYAFQKVEYFKSFLNEKATKTEQILPDKNPTNAFQHMQNVLSFIAIKQKDSQEAFPQIIQNKPQENQENKPPTSLFSMFFEEKKNIEENKDQKRQVKAHIFGPKINKFIKVMPNRALE